MVSGRGDLQDLLVEAFGGITSKNNIINVVEEVMDGSYEKHIACYNCKRDSRCRYRKQCSVSSRTATSSYFESKY